MNGGSFSATICCSNTRRCSSATPPCSASRSPKWNLYLNSICQAADCFALAAPQPPRLPDLDDEPLLRFAEVSGARLITTHNLRHVRAAAAHGITVLPPREFLRMLSAQP